jgi:hypothetical protein
MVLEDGAGRHDGVIGRRDMRYGSYRVIISNVRKDIV